MISHLPSYATNSATIGLIAGTLVERADGWLPVEDLRIGDAVQSYDGGLVRILGLDRRWITPNRGNYLLHMPGGALDNCSDLMLLPGQNLLIDTLSDDHFPDAIVALIPAAALEGRLGVRRVPFEKPLEVVTPRFADDEAIFVNSGTLLHCPGIRQQAGAATSDFFTLLDLVASQSLLSRLSGGYDDHPLRRAA